MGAERYTFSIIFTRSVHGVLIKKAGNGWLWCLRLVLFFSRMLYVYYVESLVIGENLNTIQVSLHKS